MRSKKKEKRKKTRHIPLNMKKKSVGLEKFLI